MAQRVIARLEHPAVAHRLQIPAHERALLCEVLYGTRKGPHEWGEGDLQMRMITDCRSLYDHIKRENSLCDDRCTALYLAALRQVVSAGPQRDTSRGGLLWVPSRHELADGLTKGGLGDALRQVLQ